jgi:hypothetical protein
MPSPRRAAALLGSLSLLTGGLAVVASPASAVVGADSTVFINEIH